DGPRRLIRRGTAVRRRRICPRPKGRGQPIQLFLPVTATKAVGTLTTRSLPHFGQAGLAVPCSEMLSMRSKLSPHASQRYAYVGIALASPACNADCQENMVRRALGAAPQKDENARRRGFRRARAPRGVRSAPAAHATLDAGRPNPH